MDDKFHHLIRTLAELGLHEPSQYISSVQKLYKLAGARVSSEIQVLRALSRITGELQSMDFYDILEAPLTFPGYTIETEKKVIVKEEEQLQGYTKLEVYLGLQNYLMGFIKYHLQPKEDQMYHEYRQAYSQVIESLSRAHTLLAKTNRLIVRGVSKESVATQLDRVLRTASQIKFYLHIIKRDVDKFPSIKNAPYRPRTWGEIPAEEQRELEELAKQISTYGERIKRLDFDMDQEMATIEQTFMEERSIPPQMMQQMLKAFRPDIASVNRDFVNTLQIRKAAIDDDDEGLVFEDLPRSKNEKPSATTTFPTDLKGLSEKVHQQSSEKQKKMHEELEKKKDTDTPFPSGIAMFEELQRQPDRPTDKDDLKDMVLGIISNGSVKTKNQLITGPRLERGFTHYLLPLFRIQYVALLDHALNVYMSIYRVQTAQRSLTDIFVKAARQLEALE